MIEAAVHPKPKPPPRVKTERRRLKKSSSRGAVIKRVHALMREIVLDRDKGCVTPPPEKGHSPIRQAGHLIKSTKGNVRWDLWNVHEQCSSCNKRHNEQEHYYVAWFLKTFGQQEYLRLRDEAVGVGLKTYELEEYYLQLKEIRQRQLTAILLGEPFKPYFTQAEILSGAWKLK